MKKFLVTLILLLLMAVTAQADSILLHWGKSPSTNVIRYVLYRSLQETTSYALFDSTAAGPADTVYTVLNVAPSIRYYYRVKAVASDGQRSTFSNTVSGVFLAAADPQSARITSFTKTGTGSIQVTWISTMTSVGFLQYRLSTSTTWIDSSWDLTIGTTHSITLNGLTEPATYALRACAYPNLATKYFTVSVVFSADILATPQPPVRLDLRPF